MGLIITKYEAGAGIIFDSSKFDWSYDGEDFPSVANEDVSEILLENGGVYNLARQTTTEDSLGKVTDVTHTDYRIYGMFQDITIKDRKINEMGLAVPGNRKFYYLPKYTITSGGVESTHEVKEGDIITDTLLFDGSGNTGEFRVVKVLKQWLLPGTEVYRIAIVQSINLDGTA